MNSVMIQEIRDGNTIITNFINGKPAVVTVNGIVQNPADYHVSKDNTVYFNWERPRWEPYRLRFPRRINGRWYWPGNLVYRHFTLSPGGGFWQYGDDFDYLKDTQ